jgi:rhodanese-related sulfurtransferase
MQPQQIDIKTLKEKHDHSEKTMLIDVREQDEWDAGHIPGAHHMPKGVLLEQIQSLVPQKDTIIYLQCKSGGRSQQAACLLLTQGYTQVFNVVGGITAWASAGYPIV